MNLEEKRREWKERYDNWKQSGSSVAGWCREQGLKVHQMYYWVQKFEQKTPVEDDAVNTQWLAVNMKDEPEAAMGGAVVFIHFGDISVEVRPGADMALLSDVAHVLQRS